MSTQAAEPRISPLPLVEHSAARVGAIWRPEDHAELVRQLRRVDALMLAVIDKQQRRELA